MVLKGVPQVEVPLLLLCYPKVKLDSPYGTKLYAAPCYCKKLLSFWLFSGLMFVLLKVTASPRSSCGIEIAVA